MLVSEYVTKAYLLATGKPVAPSIGSRKYNQLIELGKYFTDVWQSEPGTDWDSTFDYRNSGTITATDTFTLDSTIRLVSQGTGDYVRIVNGSLVWEYEVVPAERLWEYRYSDAVAKVGNNLMFSRAFTASDGQIGGTLVVPSYGTVEFDSDPAATIPVDDPNWLVTSVAAEFVRNDITRQNQYPNLIAQANVLMDKMKENNGGNSDTVIRSWEPLGGVFE